MSKRTDVVLTDDVYAAICEEAEKRGVSVSSLIREAVTEYMNRKGYKVHGKPRNWGGKRERKETDHE